MVETKVNTHIPFSMEVAAGVVAERCYRDKELHQAILKDPIDTITGLLNEHLEKPVNLKEALPNCKVHNLQNTSNRWHIVLPFEYHGELPSDENGLLSEEDLEQLVGGIFGLAAMSGIAVTAGAAVIASTKLGIVALGPLFASAMTGLSVIAPSAAFMSTNAILGATAGIMVGTAAITAGVTIGSLVAMDVAGIIDAGYPG